MIFAYYKNNRHHKTHHPSDFEVISSIKDNRYTVKLVAKHDVILDSLSENFFLPETEGVQVFFNGYQSWTDSKEIKLSAKEKNIYRSPRAVVKAFAMDRYGDAPFYKYNSHTLHGYDVCYSKTDEGFFVFNLNYKTAYLIFEYDKNTEKMTLISDLKGIHLKQGEEIVAMDYVYSYTFYEGLQLFEDYFPKHDIKKIFGYSSWYNYYQDINEKIITHDLVSIDERFNLFQIDDGYETFVGDWLDIDKKKFPNGLKTIVDQIHEKGLLAGIWLAPFVAEEKSRLFIEHPEFIKRDEKGNFVKSGGNWSGHYALDLEKPEVVQYIQKCLQFYIDLGFDFFKLDFLYACGLVVPDGYSRCQYQYKCYKLLRDILKDKIILGCGANIVNSIGNFDYLRVGPDVSLKWDDVVYMRFFHRERISTKTTLQNTIFRSLFNARLFGNDPDVFLLRDDNIYMNEDQKDSLALINSLFSSVLMTSDDISKYDEKKNEKFDMVLNNFLHAKNASFKKVGNQIELHYEVDGNRYLYLYDYKKGVLTRG